MTLYHGTNADIDAIDLNRGLRHKDFGKGFYLTPDRTTAIRMAQKKARLFGGTATLITYEMDDAALQSEEGELYVQSPAYLYELMEITEAI